MLENFKGYKLAGLASIKGGSEKKDDQLLGVFTAFNTSATTDTGATTEDPDIRDNK